MRVGGFVLAWVAAAFVGGCGTEGERGATGTGADAGAIVLDDGGGYWGGADSAAAYDGSGGGWGGVDAGPGPARDAGAWSGVDAGAPAPADAGPEATDAGADVCALRETMEPLTLYLSADDSNSMAAPVIARRQILEGDGFPNRSYLRTYEFLNYYNVRYPLPEADHVNVVPELRAGSSPGELVMQIGVQAPPPPEQPKDRVITLVLDTSGSMRGEPIALEREVARAIAATLREGDIVSIVEWDTRRTVPLEAHRVTGPDDPTLLAAIAALEEGGGTNLDAGLRYGYEIATRHYDERKLNRVVLVSDGQANAGETAEEMIAMHSEDAERDGIYLVGVGVGDGVNDRLMDVVTDAGRGAYVYIDTAAEARRMFTERFDEVMEVGLLDVRVELTLPWYMAVTVFHGEEISTDPKEVRPQHLAPGDAMVFHQELGACEPDLLDGSDTIHTRATYVRPDGRVAGSDEHEATIDALLARPDVGLARGDAIVAYAEALKVASDVGPGPEARAALEEALSAVIEANPEATDPALGEIERLIVRYLDRL